MKNYQINSKVASNVNNNKDIVILFLSLVAAGGMFYFIAGPTYKNYLVTKEEIKLKQQNLENKKELLDNIEEFNKENKNLSVDVDKLKVFISNRNNYEDFLALINSLVASDNLQIYNFSVEDVKKIASKNNKEVETSRLQEKVVGFAVKGDFSNFSHFIRTLENSIPFVQEDSISISFEDAAKAAAASSNGETQSINLYPSLTYEVSFKFVYY